MRKQTVHLLQAKDGCECEGREGTVNTWCGTDYPDTQVIDECTCGSCLKAAAAYGRDALARAVVLGICPVAVELPE